MTLSKLTAMAAAAALTAGCASTGEKSAAAAAPGKFVTYTCDDKLSFSVRLDNETGTARIRTHEGSAELSQGARGLYRDDEGMWILALNAGNQTELVYKSKAKYKNCSAQ
jgi:hypothetical protein